MGYGAAPVTKGKDGPGKPAPFLPSPTVQSTGLKMGAQHMFLKSLS